MKAWRVHRYGAPSQALRLDEIEAPLPGPGQVRIAVSHSVLNLNDVDGCRGRYRTVNPPLPYTAGMEVTGTVDAFGPGAEAWLGRRVVACPEGAQGGYAEQALAPVDLVFDAPPGLAGRESAAFFFPFHLSWLALHERARLAPGESVLVHAAAGGVGSAAVQLAKAAGATVFTTAGGPEKVAFCRELGADHELGEQIHTRLLELLAAGDIRPVVGREVAFAELPAALEALEARTTMGRTVVVVGSR